MEKQVDDEGSYLQVDGLAAEYEEHHHAQSGDHIEDNHNNKQHRDEALDSVHKEKSKPCEMRHEGKNQSQGIPLLHENHVSSDKDAGATQALGDKMDTHVDVLHGNEDSGMIHEPEETSASNEKQEHNAEHANEALENPSYGNHTARSKDADIIHESVEKLAIHGKNSHDHEVAPSTLEKFAHDDNVHVCPVHEFGEKRETHDNEQVGTAHGSEERHRTHRKHTDIAQNVKGLKEISETPMTQGKLAHIHTCMDSTLQEKHMHDVEAGHTSHASEKPLTVEGEKISDVEGLNVSHATEDKSPKRCEDASVAHEHGYKRSCDVIQAGMPQEHRETCRSLDDEHEYKKAFSDENSSRERVHFSRGSTPDVDTPTQCAHSPFSNTKPSNAGLRGVGNAEGSPGSTDGNLEAPSTSWAFSARASIAPSKFDHMATLRGTYAVYKETSQGKEGVPLSLAQRCETE